MFHNGFKPSTADSGMLLADFHAPRPLPPAVWGGQTFRALRSNEAGGMFHLCAFWPGPWLAGIRNHPPLFGENGSKVGRCCEEGVGTRGRGGPIPGTGWDRIGQDRLG